MKKKLLLTVGAVAIFLLALSLLATKNFEGNVSSLLHVGREFGETHEVPAGIVLYEDGGYDGMLYYQVAREIPAFFSNAEPLFGSAYRWQRILLPLFAFLFSGGNEDLFPLIILLINCTALLGALALLFWYTKKISVHALAIIGNPASIVGLLYSLTEPLSIFFITAFLVLWEKRNHQVDLQQMALLALAMLARETTLFLIGLFLLWTIMKKNWKGALYFCASLLPFFIWQVVLILRFGELPLGTGSQMLNIPFTGPLTLLLWSAADLSVYRLSALCMLVFVILLALWLCREWRAGERGVYLFLLSGLTAVMLSMDAHIWGVITSIGRVVTPIYPIYVLTALRRDTWMERGFSSILIGISIATGIGIALITHPFILS